MTAAVFGKRCNLWMCFASRNPRLNDIAKAIGQSLPWISVVSESALAPCFKWHSERPHNPRMAVDVNFSRLLKGLGNSAGVIVMTMAQYEKIGFGEGFVKSSQARRANPEE